MVWKTMHCSTHPLGALVTPKCDTSTVWVRTAPDINEGDWVGICYRNDYGIILCHVVPDELPEIKTFWTLVAWSNCIVGWTNCALLESVHVSVE